MKFHTACSIEVWPDVTRPIPCREPQKIGCPVSARSSPNCPAPRWLDSKLSKCALRCWASNQARIAIIIMLVAISPSHWNMTIASLISCHLHAALLDLLVIEESKVREEKITGSSIRLTFKLKRPPWTKKRYLTPFSFVRVKSPGLPWPEARDSKINSFAYMLMMGLSSVGHVCIFNILHDL